MEDNNSFVLTTSFDSFQKNNEISKLNEENIDDYYKKIFTILIKMLDLSLEIGTIERLETDLQQAQLRYANCTEKSNEVDRKISEVQYILMCKYLEAKKLEKAQNLCSKFNKTMEEYIVERTKPQVPNVVEANNFYAAMLRIDIAERVNINVNSLKFWEGILNIEKPAEFYRLPREWQPDSTSLMTKSNSVLPTNSISYFGILRVFKIRYVPQNLVNKMNLSDVQKLREYLIRPKVTKNIRIVFEEGIEDIHLDLSIINSLCKFSIKLPSTCKSIGGSLFKENTNIKKIDLSQTQIESINEDTFKNSNIKKFKAPYTLKQIGSNAFKNCERLKNVDLSNSCVENIKKEAFSNSGIKQLRLSRELKNIDLEAFANCKDLEVLDLSDTSINKLDVGFLSNSGVAKIKLPSSISSINFGVFSDCKNLKEVDLSNTNIRRIGAYSFFNSAVETIKLPSTVELVEYEAFGNCKNLKKIDFSKTRLARIAPYAFYGSSVTEVKLPDTIKEVSETSFKHCPELKKINLDEKVVVN